MTQKVTPRKEVKQFVGEGLLRSVLEQHPNGLSSEGIDLIVRVVLNYCDDKPKSIKFFKRY